MRLRHGAVVVATTLFFQVDPLQAQSDSRGWSQFRGPNGSGVAEGCRPPTEIDPDRAAWKVSVPPGLSSPVVAHGHLYTISEKGVVSVVKTGDELQLVHQHDLGEAVSATPAIDESTLYIRTSTQLVAFRRE